MNNTTISFQREFCQELPYEIKATKNFYEYQTLLERISDIIDTSKIADELHKYLLERLSKKERKRRSEELHRHADRIIRLSVARKLRGEALRDFSCSLAESIVLQRFCRLVEFGKSTVRIPGKSSLCAYEKLMPNELLAKINHTLIGCVMREKGADIVGLKEAINIKNCYLDTTCLEANIHYPVDWGLLRDATLSLMRAVITIRKRDLKTRMPQSPEVFIAKMNNLAMKMSYAVRQKDSKKKRKHFFREMKKLLRKIEKHGQRHRDILELRWEETDLLEGEKDQIVKRINNILEQLPAIVRQANTRIISERKVVNAEKILSLYEHDVHVITRKKSGKEVEFGNILSFMEQENGLIVDSKLYKERSVADAVILPERINALDEKFGKGKIEQLTTDRGFNSKKNKKFLLERGIHDNTCPRSVDELIMRFDDESFMVHQKRRGQTEARIGIFKNVFLGKPFRNKGFEYREGGVEWCVLAHNLWALARLPQKQQVIKTNLAA